MPPKADKAAARPPKEGGGGKQKKKVRRGAPGRLRVPGGQEAARPKYGRRAGCPGPQRPALATPVAPLTGDSPRLWPDPRRGWRAIAALGPLLSRRLARTRSRRLPPARGRPGGRRRPSPLRPFLAPGAVRLACSLTPGPFSPVPPPFFPFPPPGRVPHRSGPRAS